MFYLIAGIVVLIGGYFVLSKGKSDLPRSQDYPKGFAHRDNLAPEPVRVEETA